MNRDQFITMLISKLYKNTNALIEFDDGSVITEDLLIKILDAISETSGS